MAYFNHAFCKTFLATSALNADGTATSALTAGQLSVVDESDWESLAAGSIATAGGLLYLVQGSFRTSDNIGNNPGHGGYAESVKSKGINPRYVTRIWGAEVVAATQSTSTVSVASDCAPCGENLFLRLDVKGSPALRFLNHNAYAIGDSSGDAEANGGPLPGLCCADGQEFLDPALALAAAAQMVLADPIVSPFIREESYGSGPTFFSEGMTITDTAGNLDGIDTATPAAGTGYAVGDLVQVVQAGAGGSVLRVDTVGGGGVPTALSVVRAGHGYSNAAGLATVSITGSGDDLLTVTIVIDPNLASYAITNVLNGVYTPSTDPVADGVTASVTFQGAYVSTQFGNCSFDTRDHYEKEPVQIIASILDETGDPCNECGVVTNVPGTMAQTLGHKVKLDLLQTDAYMQSPYNQGNADSARIREIEGSDLITAAVTSNVDLYKVYYLQHSVPRFNNPTGVFDNDQYLYQIYVPQADAVTQGVIETLLTAIATDAGLPAPDYDIEV